MLDGFVVSRIVRVQYSPKQSPNKGGKKTFERRLKVNLSAIYGSYIMRRRRLVTCDSSRICSCVDIFGEVWEAELFGGWNLSVD